MLAHLARASDDECGDTSETASPRSCCELRFLSCLTTDTKPLFMPAPCATDRDQASPPPTRLAFLNHSEPWFWSFYDLESPAALTPMAIGC